MPPSDPPPLRLAPSGRLAFSRRTSTPSSTAACDRLIPGRRTRIRAPPRSASPTTSTGCSARSTFDPPRIFAGGPFSGRAGGDASFDRLPAALAATKSSRGAPASKVRTGSPEREFNGPVARLAGDLPRRHRRARRRLRRRRRRRAGPAARRDTASSTQLLYEHACEGAYGAPEYGGNRDLRGLGRDRVPRRRPAARLHRRGGQRPCLSPTPDCDAVDRRHRTGRRDRGRRAHRGGLVGDHAREGPQPPARARARRSSRSATCRTTRSSSSAATSSGPIRSSSRARTAATTPTATTSFVGRGQQPAVDRRRRRLPRRRQAAPLPRGRLPGPLASSARSTVPTSSTGRSTTTRWSRTTRRPSGSSASPATRARTRSPRGARARTRCRPGADMFGAVLTDRGRDPARLPPLPRADRRELRRVRRPARVQQLRVLRRSSAARSTPRATRSRRCATRCAPAAARSGPSPTSTESLLDPTGRTRTRRALPRRRRQRARGDRARVVIVAAGAFETPRLLLRIGDRRTRRTSSAATSCTTSRRSCSASSRSACTGTAAASVTHLHDDHMIVDADEPRRRRSEHGLPYFRGRHRRARRRRPPGASEAMYTDPGPGHTRGDARLADARPPVARSRCRARTCPQATNRVDLDPHVRDVFGLPGRARHLRRRTATRSSRRATARRSSRQSCAKRARSTTFSITSPPARRATARHGVSARRSRATSWARAAWATTRARAWSTGGSASTTWRTCCAPTRRCSRPRPATARR